MNLDDQLLVRAGSISIETSEGVMKGTFGLFRYEKRDEHVIYITDEMGNAFRDILTEKRLEKTFLGSGNESRMKALVSILSQLDDKVKFRRQESSIFIQVVEKQTGGMDRVRWRSEASHSSHVDATAALARALTIEQHHTSTLQEELNELLQSRDAWKKTAQDLEGRWEKEKREILGRFLVIYNERKKPQSHASTAGLAHSNHGRLGGAQGKASLKQESLDEEDKDVVMAGAPDDHDELFDDDFAKKMAAGESVSHSNRVYKEREPSALEVDDQPIVKKENLENGEPVSGGLDKKRRLSNADDSSVTDVDEIEVKQCAQHNDDSSATDVEGPPAKKSRE